MIYTCKKFAMFDRPARKIRGFQSTVYKLHLLLSNLVGQSCILQCPRRFLHFKENVIDGFPEEYVENFIYSACMVSIQQLLKGNHVLDSFLKCMCLYCTSTVSKLALSSTVRKLFMHCSY